MLPKEVHNLLSKRAELAQKLRQNLTNPAIRDAVRQRCSSMPHRTSVRSAGSAPEHRLRGGATGGARTLSRERAPVPRPASRERLERRSAAPSALHPSRERERGQMQKSSSTGALSSGSATSRPSLRGKVPAQVNPEPIPIRGRRGQKVSTDAQAALARAVASLLGDGSSASAVSAVQAASSAGGPLQEELIKVSKQLTQLDRERQQLAENGLSMLARCSSQERSVAPDKASAPSGRGTKEEPLLSEGEPSEHPWLLADGRLVTARLEGENLALKRAVMQARREIDELLKGRADAEARVRTLKEENHAAAEALRRYTSSLLDPSSAEAGAGGALSHGGSFASLNSLSLQSLHLGGRNGDFGGTGALPGRATSGDSAAGGVGNSGISAGGGDSGKELQAEKQARNKLLQTSDEITRRMEELLSRRGKSLQKLLEPMAGQAL